MKVKGLQVCIYAFSLDEFGVLKTLLTQVGLKRFTKGVTASYRYQDKNHADKFFLRADSDIYLEELQKRLLSFLNKNNHGFFPQDSIDFILKKEADRCMNVATPSTDMICERLAREALLRKVGWYGDDLVLVDDFVEKEIHKRVYVLKKGYAGLHKKKQTGIFLDAHFQERIIEVLPNHFFVPDQEDVHRVFNLNVLIAMHMLKRPSKQDVNYLAFCKALSFFIHNSSVSTPLLIKYAKDLNRSLRGDGYVIGTFASCLHLIGKTEQDDVLYASLKKYIEQLLRILRDKKFHLEKRV